MSSAELHPSLTTSSQSHIETVPEGQSQPSLYPTHTTAQTAAATNNTAVTQNPLEKAAHQNPGSPVATGHIQADAHGIQPTGNGNSDGDLRPLLGNNTALQRQQPSVVVTLHTKSQEANKRVRFHDDRPTTSAATTKASSPGTNKATSKSESVLHSADSVIHNAKIYGQTDALKSRSMQMLGKQLTILNSLKETESDLDIKKRCQEKINEINILLSAPEVKSTSSLIRQSTSLIGQQQNELKKVRPGTHEHMQLLLQHNSELQRSYKELQPITNPNEIALLRDALKKNAINIANNVSIHEKKPDHKNSLKNSYNTEERLGSVHIAKQTFELIGMIPVEINTLEKTLSDKIEKQRNTGFDRINKNAKRVIYNQSYIIKDSLSSKGEIIRAIDILQHTISNLNPGDSPHTLSVLDQPQQKLIRQAKDALEIAYKRLQKENKDVNVDSIKLNYQKFHQQQESITRTLVDIRSSKDKTLKTNETVDLLSNHITDLDSFLERNNLTPKQRQEANSLKAECQKAKNNLLRNARVRERLETITSSLPKGSPSVSSSRPSSPFARKLERAEIIQQSKERIEANKLSLSHLKRTIETSEDKGRDPFVKAGLEKIIKDNKQTLEELSSVQLTAEEEKLKEQINEDLQKLYAIQEEISTPVKEP